MFSEGTYRSPSASCTNLASPSCYPPAQVRAACTPAAQSRRRRSRACSVLSTRKVPATAGVRRAADPEQQSGWRDLLVIAVDPPPRRSIHRLLDHACDSAQRVSRSGCSGYSGSRTPMAIASGTSAPVWLFRFMLRRRTDRCSATLGPRRDQQSCCPNHRGSWDARPFLARKDSSKSSTLLTLRY